ncbi:MAG: DNA polymerase III subunit delta [Actinomycetota bacterium]
MKQLTLIISDSEFLASLELDRVRAQWVKKGYAVEEISTDDTQALFYALDTQSLFGDGRFIVVRGSAKDLDAHAERIASWADSPPAGVAAAFVFGGAAKLKKAIGARADVIEPAAPKPWETAEWLVRHVKGLGRVMSKDAATALVEAVGTDLRELATAADQLTMATSGSIGVDTVTKLFRGFETALYTFLESLLQRDRGASLRHLAALTRSGTHPLQIVNALGNQLRALAAARDAGRVPAAQLARELDVSVGYANRAQKYARNFDAGEVRRAFRLLADADLALKGGLGMGEDNPPELVMELLVSEICGDRPAAAAPRRR